ncbi:Phosphotransferase enzyme family protein [Lentzea fradiae]|uniref:Phosphotransferase enzyme family protein n=1 Tax=Lentzea fradiae TaxID=200378 RepID=A0A1G7KL74_9PSEU|nr:aminoglycoside phosphotransferase family protein [Lentzea fradiae]SDF37915.1 Phosphotransferase enzyme family protein [Lentzea fradiae]
MDERTLNRVLAAAGVDPATVTGWAELTGGTFNAAYRIGTTGGGYVLKVAPPPDSPGLTYERDLMRTETAFYRAVRGHAPVPEVVHADFSRGLVASDLLLMTEIPGHTLAASPPPARRKSLLRADLGRVVAGLHEVTGTGFGYPQLGLAPTWREAFAGMVDAVLADAARYGVVLPEPAARIADLVRSHGNLLDEVTRPVLVHFDLWDGNVLAHDGRVTGLVDGERAFWGDPLAELVSLALFGDIEQDHDFLAGYGAAPFTRSARLRLALYRAYLYLIMLVEGVPRRHSGPRHEEQRRRVRDHLGAALGVLRPGAH